MFNKLFYLLHFYFTNNLLIAQSTKNLNQSIVYKNINLHNRPCMTNIYLISVVISLTACLNQIWIQFFCTSKFYTILAVQGVLSSEQSLALESVCVVISGKHFMWLETSSYRFYAQLCYDHNYSPPILGYQKPGTNKET